MSRSGAREEDLADAAAKTGSPVEISGGPMVISGGPMAKIRVGTQNISPGMRRSAEPGRVLPAGAEKCSWPTENVARRARTFQGAVRHRSSRTQRSAEDLAARPGAATCGSWRAARREELAGKRAKVAKPRGPARGEPGTARRDGARGSSARPKAPGQRARRATMVMPASWTFSRSITSPASAHQARTCSGDCRCAFIGAYQSKLMWFISSRDILGL